jgi:hypothetical protein
VSQVLVAIWQPRVQEQYERAVEIIDFPMARKARMLRCVIPSSAAALWTGRAVFG